MRVNLARGLNEPCGAPSETEEYGVSKPTSKVPALSQGHMAQVWQKKFFDNI